METQPLDPAEKDTLNVRLPSWAKAAHQRKANRTGEALSVQIRSVLCASALVIIEAEQRATQPDPASQEA